MCVRCLYFFFFLSYYAIDCFCSSFFFPFFLVFYSFFLVSSVRIQLSGHAAYRMLGIICCLSCLPNNCALGVCVCTRYGACSIARYLCAKRLLDTWIAWPNDRQMQMLPRCTSTRSTVREHKQTNVVCAITFYFFLFFSQKTTKSFAIVLLFLLPHSVGPECSVVFRCEKPKFNCKRYNT